MQTIKGKLIDLEQRKIIPSKIEFSDKIVNIYPDPDVPDQYLLPGFIDAHVHIESSMLVPTEFARIAVCHGTVATVSDPHEIANVCGMEGVRYMISNAEQVPFHFYFGAPSCVPATTFETSGAIINANAIKELLQDPSIQYLAEMMNYPGVLQQNEEVVKKINAAKALDKPIDGHAPQLTGANAIKYIKAGISTDHECVSYEEALHKLNHGMKILIREGSAAKNFNSLIPLAHDFSNQLMFCSDDKHPDDLLRGHINLLVKKAVNLGYNLFDILSMACINPIDHYNLNVGRLKIGDPADFIVVSDIEDWSVLKTFILGELVAQNGKTKLKTQTPVPINHFGCKETKESDFAISIGEGKIRVIQAYDGSLLTSSFHYPLQNNRTVPNLDEDILKIAVVNRYENQKPAIGFIRGFGLRKGAIASSVAHDSHNIISVGISDKEISRAVNLVIKHQGGISFADGNRQEVLPLPIAGIMSDQFGEKVANHYEKIDQEVKTSLGSTLTAPYMTLSFMALLVIPSLKISDLGLFDGNEFKFVPVQLD